MKILIETSARHLHLSQQDLETLFGKGYELTRKKDLSQPGQYACEERVTVVGPKKQLSGVSVLGPVRAFTQVELSATDARVIGLPVVVKESGDIAGTPGCILQGPQGQIEIKEGVIVAKRHIHMTTAQAKELNVNDKQIVSVKINSPQRSLIFGDVVVRANDSFALAMHLDTDESNAVQMDVAEGEIIK